MDDLLATATTLDRVLLETDEEEYDSTAVQILIALRKVPLNDQASLAKVGTTTSDVTLTPTNR